ncbi:MAG TPA: hypothetical protein VMM13_05850 [Euzebya sp.]|nr:hypothetical protein [Euzebya sp.]
MGRRRAARVVTVVVSVGLVARLGGLGQAEMVRAWRLLGDVAPGVVGILIALEVVWAWSLSRVLAGGVHAVGGHITGAAALRTSMAAFTLSRTVPGGGAAGGLFAARELTRLGHRPGVALAALTTSWAVTTTALAGVLLVGGVVAVPGDVPLT